ncbi:hypothetical protein MKW92_011790 [Papaver armeniacum]|nr:hypothetical protein MKW92_011790 [Papaver armeniacum]
MLANIDLRLRDIFASSEPFGNISIVLVGDIRQLPPVFDTPLYAQGGRDLQLIGSLSYSVFDQCVRLDMVFRQSGDEESLFRDALFRLSDGKSTLQDWQLFNTRDHTIMLFICFPPSPILPDHNVQRLKELGYPVARISSENNCETAKGADSDEAKGLQKVVLLSKGARVMLRKNLSTQYGLVNGSTGTVVDVVYLDGKIAPGDMPIAVMVKFDKYTGPQVYEGSNLDIIFRGNMPAETITTSFMLGYYGAQKPGVNT